MMASLSFNMGGTWTCHVDCLWPLALTSDQPMIPLFCMQWSLRAYPKESEGAGGRFYIGQTTLGALAVTWPLKNLRDVAKKKTGKGGNFKKTGGGGLPKSHFFCNLTKCFLACQIHSGVLKHVLQYGGSVIWSVWSLYVYFVFGPRVLIL